MRHKEMIMVTEVRNDYNGDSTTHISYTKGVTEDCPRAVTASFKAQLKEFEELPACTVVKVYMYWEYGIIVRHRLFEGPSMSMPKAVYHMLQSEPRHRGGYKAAQRHIRQRIYEQEQEYVSHFKMPPTDCRSAKSWT